MVRIKQIPELLREHNILSYNNIVNFLSLKDDWTILLVLKGNLLQKLVGVFLFFMWCFNIFFFFFWKVYMIVLEWFTPQLIPWTFYLTFILPWDQKVWCKCQISDNQIRPTWHFSDYVKLILRKNKSWGKVYISN